MRVAHVSTFSPCQCGIATFAEDLISHLRGVESLKLRMLYDNETPSTDLFSSIRLENFPAYSEAAHAINAADVDLTCLQHEFGIYGGKDGEYVQCLIAGIKGPIVSTLHTTTPLLTSHRRGILQQIVDASVRVVVLSDESADYLRTFLRCPAEKVCVIRHGVPDVHFLTPEASPLRRAYSAPLVIVSAGHIRPSKGYAIALAALAQLKQRGVPFVYVILGSSQAQWDTTGEYQATVEDSIRALGLQENVVWVRRYLKWAEYIQHIQAADVGLVPYTEQDQVSSGVLPLILACGRPVVATEFAFAKSIARSVDGVFLAGINDPARICGTLREIGAHPERLRPLMSACYAQTRPWLWKHSAGEYKHLYCQAIGVSKPAKLRA